ncbi:DUF6119 family protein [Actinoplanes sp. DH11]|uniref:DUF6119 family protein n=1 Tax=Actinoplanes sp. DH11 TaxID=2857011 RepID=UPI001E60914A|nr:DUF6119 family protein [Actinoplanes sp. DH11]
MKINIFSVPPDNLAALEEKFETVGLEVLAQDQQDGWEAKFYFSQNEEPNPIPWVETFSDFFKGKEPSNLIYFAAYVFSKSDHCFVLTYGKSHFYVRQHCDHDFGIEMAKRIGTEGDIKQTGSKRFAGRKRKEIRSYTRNSPLDIESGESVDYLRTTIHGEARKRFGQVGKFGSSALLNVPMTKDQIGSLLNEVVELLKQDENFKLPRTTVIRDEEELRTYNEALLDAILDDDSAAEFSHDMHDLVGVDFVFTGHERYTLSLRGKKREFLGERELDVADLRQYITSERIPREDVLDIKIKVEAEDRKPYTKALGDAIEFVVDGENVMLAQGRWVRFNEDYVDQLDSSIDSITIEATELDLQSIAKTEGEFNDSDVVKNHGYLNADKDFTKIVTLMSVPVEAWDLYRSGVVYAVKFGTAQKLGYVCDQASNVLEILRNNANIKKLDQEVMSYCLWFGFKTVSVPTRISQTGSIILKQKIDAWARRCRDLKIEPKLKFSLRV